MREGAERESDRKPRKRKREKAPDHTKAPKGTERQSERKRRERKAPKDKVREKAPREKAPSQRK